MTRSIFDPDGGETERSGSRNLGGDADATSPIAANPLNEIVDDSDAESEDAVMDMPSIDEIMKSPDSTAKSGNPKPSAG